MMDDNSGLLPYQHIEWPRIRKAELYCAAKDVTGRRLLDYLHAMGLPAGLAEHWRKRAQKSEDTAAHAFVRLRLLISNHEPEGDEVVRFSETDLSVMPRLSSWLEPEHMQCPAWLKNLCELPPIHRRSMSPESWDD